MHSAERHNDNNEAAGSPLKGISFDRAPTGSECAVHAVPRRTASRGVSAATIWLWATRIRHRSNDACAAGCGSNESRTPRVDRKTRQVLRRRHTIAFVWTLSLWMILVLSDL